jgi:hypothetical protein
MKEMTAADRLDRQGDVNGGRWGCSRASSGRSLYRHNVGPACQDDFNRWFDRERPEVGRGA